MRINKFISHNSGFSRREADELIKQGKVKINGHLAKLSDDVAREDKVHLKNKRLVKKSKFSVVLYHKDKGELVSKKDDRNRKIIYDFLPKNLAHFIPVGRLDYASSGLLLLTDSPVIASFLMQSDLEREYYLKLRGEISQSVVDAMSRGLSFKGCKKGAHELSKIDSMEIKPFVGFEIFGSSGGYTKLKVIINEGKNRELRRFFGYFDLEVVELKRVAFGVLELGGLRVHGHRYLSNNEYERLREYLKEMGVYY